MFDLEKQLNNLPKKKLSKKADLLIRFRVYKLIWQKKFRDIHELQFSLPKMASVAAILLILAVIICVPSYAYASSKVTKEHFLYPVKKKIEAIELNLATSPEKKAKTFSKLAERRLAEAEILSQDENDKNQKIFLETLEEAMELSDLVESEINKSSKKQEKEKINKKISTSKKEQLATLESIAQTVGPTALEPTVENVAVALEKMKKNKKNIFQKKENFFESNKEEKKDVEGKKIEKQRNKSPFAKATEDKEETERVQKSLDIIKDRVEELDNDLTLEEYEPKDVENLFKRLNKNVKKAQNSIDKNKLNNLNGLLKSTEALTNNAKHFIKKKKKQKNNPSALKGISP